MSRTPFALDSFSKTVTYCYLAMSISLICLYVFVFGNPSETLFSIGRINVNFLIGSFLMPVAVVLVSRIIARFVHLVARSDLRGRAANTAYTMVLLLGIIGPIASVIFGAMNDDGTTARPPLERALRDLSVDPARALATISPTLSVSDTDLATQPQADDDSVPLADELDRAGAASRSSMGAMYRAAATVMRRIDAPMRRYNQATLAYLQAGAGDPATLSEAGDIDGLIGLLDEVDASNAALRAAQDSYFSDMEAAMRREGVADGVITRMLDQMRETGAIELQLSLRELDSEFASLSKTRLRLLKEKWGEWGFDADTGELVFEDDSLTNRYHSQGRRLEQIAQLQQKMARVYLESVEAQVSEVKP